MSDTVHGAYTISTDPGRLDADRVHHWLSTDAYWAIGRSRETHDRAVGASLNFGAYETSTGEMAGYARVVTDHAVFAYLCDVYIDRPARGGGLGTALVTAVRDHLAALGVRRVLLTTDDAHGVYEKIGFKTLAHPGDWLVFPFQQPPSATP